MRPVLLLLTFLAACSRGEWVRDYHGDLPGVHWLGEYEGRHATLINDERTGLPIPRAKLTVFAEDSEPDARPGRVLYETVGNEFGIVSVPWDPSFRGAHWVFDKAGYGPCETFGAADQTETLSPGRNIRGQLLDPQGRPVAGVEIETFLGCPHSPTVRRATTDAHGRFVLEHSHDEVNFWAAKSGGLPLLGWPGRLPVPGYEFAPFRADPAITVSGVLYDSQGKPVPDCPVWSNQYPRGPKTRSDSNGRFVLEGCEPRAEIEFADPAVRTDMEWTKPLEVAPEQPKERRLVRVHVPGDEGKYAVWFDRDEVFEPELTDFFEVFTHHEGRLVLSFEHEDYGYGQIEVDVFGPETDIPREAFPIPGFLAVLDADGRPPGKHRIDIWHDGSWYDDLAAPGRGWLFQPGARLRLWPEDDDRVVNYRTLSGDSPFLVRLGGCSLELRIKGAEDPVGILDGSYWAGDGSIVRGLDAGPHTVLVGARGCVGKAARVVLEPNEHRVLELTLEPRPASASR